MGWTYLTFPTLQQLNSWIWGMDNKSTLYWAVMIFMLSYLFYLQVRFYIVLWRTLSARFEEYSQIHEDGILNLYEVSSKEI